MAFLKSETNNVDKKPAKFRQHYLHYGLDLFAMVKINYHFRLFYVARTTFTFSLTYATFELISGRDFV